MPITLAVTFLSSHPLDSTPHGRGVEELMGVGGTGLGVIRPVAPAPPGFLPTVDRCWNQIEFKLFWKRRKLRPEGSAWVSQGI